MIPAARLGLRLRYAAAQAARVAWYGGNGYLMRRRLAARSRPADRPPPRPAVPASTRAVPGWDRLLADVAALFADDLANVERGLYPAPAGLSLADLPGLAGSMRRFHEDAEKVAERRRTGASQEASESAPAHLPRYYRQNFHFQTDGWLSADSARLYDTQVEVLFTGAAAAMRRQALVPLAELLARRDQRRLRFADVASGTGTFLSDLTAAFPRLPVAAVDLSEPYLREGRQRRRRRSRVLPVVANAERLPFADGALDAASVLYLFHELPPKIRRVVAREIGRILAPGGLLVVVDSLQHGDVPDYDGLLDAFPLMFHEPYFSSFLDEDFSALFAEAGFAVEASWPAFLSKVMVLRRG